MEKIKMLTPLVEIDGDEMTRVIWKMVKDNLLCPYIDLETVYYDLSLENRDFTSDKVTEEAAQAIKKYGVGVKCATITPNRARVQEYDLKQMYPSPNGTIRAILDGTVFRCPIICQVIKPYIPNWKKPITIARHAYGDLYKAVEIAVDKPGSASLCFIDNDGKKAEKRIFDFPGDGVVLGQFNTLESIKNFAYSCFNYALETRQDLWFSTKDTISKVYDHTFKDVFEYIYEKQYKSQFEQLGIKYFYTLIDDAIARVIKSEGGFIWALKNYDGDVMSDMVATGYGALAMMTSVLVSPDGNYEFEAAHGTVQKHYYSYKNGEKTSTNSVATIFAWTGALRKRGQMDKSDDLVAFADRLEKATLLTIENGNMTKDLAQITSLKKVNILNTEEFILAVKDNLDNPNEDNDSEVSELYEDFFDTRSYKKKIEIIKKIGGRLTDKMISDFACSLDIVINEGSWDERYTSLISCLSQMARFESEGLR